MFLGSVPKSLLGSCGGAALGPCRQLLRVPWDPAACRNSSPCCHGVSFPLCSRFLLQLCLRFSLIRASQEALLVGLCSEYPGKYFSDSKLLAAGVKYSPVAGVWAVQKSALLLYSCDLQVVLKRPKCLSLSVCTATTKHECTRANLKKV